MSSFLDSQFMSDAYDKCIDATDTVADATSIMYSAIASKALPDHIADQIGHAIGGIVHDNWQYSCDLPWSIADDYTNISNYFTGQTPDTSTSTQFENTDTSQVPDVCETYATDGYIDFGDCDSATSADSD